MTSPFVTVVIPVYNCEHYVAETLRSVLSQEGVELEVVCVDDGSTDRSAAIVESFVDPRIRLVRRPTAGGRPSRATSRSPTLGANTSPSLIPTM